MFDFDEMEAALPPEAFVVHGAGSPEVNGLYEDTRIEAFDAPIFRHNVMSGQLLARERSGDRYGWLIGANRRPLYGVRTEEMTCPKNGWRAFKGDKPAPIVEGFSSLVDACNRLAEVWCEEADDLTNQGSFRLAAEAYKRALGISILTPQRRAELHAFRARSFRQLAESKKRVRNVEDGKDEGEIGQLQDDPLHGLAAEWAIEEAEAALALHEKCFLAGWEGAIAAKHIGWWNKGRALAKQAMQAVPSGPQHRAQRETASTLFLLLAEEEQEEKARKVLEMQRARKPPEVKVDPKDIEWARTVAAQLNEVLKEDDFRRPHHQLWKMIGPGLLKKDSDELFGEIRNLVWEKFNHVAWQHGYRTSWDLKARQKFCGRLVDIANNARAEDIKKLIKEIEERTCVDWPEMAEAVDKPQYDETWAFTRRDDGTWGAWNSSTTA